MITLDVHCVFHGLKALQTNMANVCRINIFCSRALWRHFKSVRNFFVFVSQTVISHRTCCTLFCARLRWTTGRHMALMQEPPCEDGLLWRRCIFSFSSRDRWQWSTLQIWCLTHQILTWFATAAGSWNVKAYIFIRVCFICNQLNYLWTFEVLFVWFLFGLTFVSFSFRLCFCLFFIPSLFLSFLSEQQWLPVSHTTHITRDDEEWRLRVFHNQDNTIWTDVVGERNILEVKM